MPMLDEVALDVMRSMSDPEWSKPTPGETDEQRAQRVNRTNAARHELAGCIRAAAPKDSKP